MPSIQITVLKNLLDNEVLYQTHYVGYYLTEMLPSFYNIDGLTLGACRNSFRIWLVNLVKAEPNAHTRAREVLFDLNNLANTTPDSIIIIENT
jgi:hypothetical protein